MSDENAQVAALLDASVDCLKTFNAKELLKTFIASERVQQDLELALQKVHILSLSIR